MMRSCVLIALAALLAAAVGCQEESGADAGPDAADDGGADAGGEPACELDIQRIHDDVAFFAADDLEGRAPGSQGNQDALDRVETLFDQLGLEPAGESSTFRQPFSYEQWSNRDSSLTVDGSPYNQWSDYAVFQYSGAAQVTAELVFVGYGITIPPFDGAAYPNCPLDPAVGYDDYADIDVTDKVALVMRHGPADDEDIYLECPANDACVGGPDSCTWLFGYKAANAAQHGALSMLLVQHYAETAYIMEGATVGPEYYADDFAALFVNRDKIEYAVPDLPTWATAIDESMEPASALTGVEAELDVDVGVETIETENLLGSIPGASLADEVVLIGANIDALGVDLKTGIVYSGADANATGTAVMMELARFASELQPARTLVFAAWNARDAGLLGSEYYTGHPTHPLGDFEAVLSLDMLGAGDGIGVQVVGGALPANAWIVGLLQGAAAEEGLPFEVVAAPAPENPTADDYHFGLYGVPAVRISTIGEHFLHHTPDDAIGTIVDEDLEAGACLVRSAFEPLALGTEDQYADKAAPASSVLPEPTAFWVLLADKGVSSSRLALALDARQAELSARALDRRRRVRGDRGLDERDLDVHAKYVDRVAATGARVRSTSRWINAVSVEADRAQREGIAALPFVTGLRAVARRMPRDEAPPIETRYPHYGDSDYGIAATQLEMIGAPALHACGYTGAGVVVGVQDGGFMMLHESLDHIDVLAEHDFINDDDYTIEQSGDPPGQHDHGTSVLSLVAGWDEGTFCGVAPDVTVILSKTEDVSQEVPSEEDLWVEGLEWIEGLGADIMTTSLGYSLWYDGLEDVDGETAVTTIAAAIAVENGLIMFNSAGNSGPAPMTISAPADAEGLMAVGALQFDGHIAAFSSRGPTYDGRTKPDISAPGVDVWVANPNTLDGYQQSSGTSFASPLTAGLAALLLEAYPDYGPEEMYDLMTSTANMADLPNNQYGWGLVSGEVAAPLSCTCHDDDDDGFYDAECGGDDCDDADPGINPDAEDTPGDGIDQDCDGADAAGPDGNPGAGGGGGCDCRLVAAGRGGSSGLWILAALILGLAVIARRAASGRGPRS